MNPVAMARTASLYGQPEQTWQTLVMWCPACDHMVSLSVSKPADSDVYWEWDGDLEAPTLSPSIMTRTGPGMDHVCHSFLRAGIWEYLPDCTHRMANQNVPMVPLPDWLVS